ncbi:HAD-IA family hydrolase [Candidatus Woesearchaeota archaeon]|nr:HAD-IA family hydrolase [Candidatus Woesearchaeota archaeon]
MIKLIIFDFSGVCYTEEEKPYLHIFADKHKLKFEEIEPFFNELIVKSERDEISGKEVWNRVMKEFKIKEKYGAERIIKEMVDIKEEKKDMLELARTLGKRYKTAFFTNYNRDFWLEVEKRFNPAKYFDYGIVSYQIISRKPEPKGFLGILEHFKVKPEEAVFTDDSLKNVLKAKELGINAIHFKGKDEFVKELKKLGVNV